MKDSFGIVRRFLEVSCAALRSSGFVDDRGMIPGLRGRSTRNDAERILPDRQLTAITCSNDFAALHLRGSPSGKEKHIQGAFLTGAAAHKAREKERG